MFETIKDLLGVDSPEGLLSFILFSVLAGAIFLLANRTNKNRDEFFAQFAQNNNLLFDTIDGKYHTAVVYGRYKETDIVIKPFGKGRSKTWQAEAKPEIDFPRGFVMRENVFSLPFVGRLYVPRQSEIEDIKFNKDFLFYFDRDVEGRAFLKGGRKALLSELVRKGFRVEKNILKYVGFYQGPLSQQKHKLETVVDDLVLYVKRLEAIEE